MKTMSLLWVFFMAFQMHAQISDFDTIDFKKADSIALAYKGFKLDDLSDLSYKLTSHLNTDVERFRAIYMWVCANIKNDYGQYEKIKRKRHRFRDDSLKLYQWNASYKEIFFNRLFKQKKTICTGYAYLVKKLADLAHLDCEIVHGYGRTSTTDIDKLNAPNHSWNAVQLNGKWYLCDPTWASGMQDPMTHEFTFQYNDGYFLTSAELFALDHYPIDKKWLLLGNKTYSFETFLETPVIYGNAYKILAYHKAPEKLHNTVQKYEKVLFKYQLIKPVTSEQVYLVIDNGSNSKKTHPVSTIINEQSLTMEYQFSKDGFYDVHLFIGNNLISTYTFEVKG